MIRLAVLTLALLPALADARIPRDRSEVRAFRNENPCPSTGLKRGRCDGWQVDHIVALCAGGPDKRENMQWINLDDHRFKTYVDLRECRKVRLRSGG